MKWTVWDGGYDGYNYVSRQPFFENELVYHYDATDYEVNFLQNLFIILVIYFHNSTWF